jgi:hypothetical protein
MADKQVYYFVDTREGAKSDQPFGIDNPDVAKKFTREFAIGEGPFKPVDSDEVEYQINRFDLKENDKNTTSNQKAATAHNMELVYDEEIEPSAYSEMTKAELKDELDAREIEYKTSGPESTNEAYIKLLVADDNQSE